MSNPTDYFGWLQPRASEDPWYPRFATLIQDIDTSIAFVGLFVPLLNTTVTQVETSAPPHATLIFSARPTGTAVLSFGPDGFNDFIVASFSPQGAVVGSFSVVGSGRVVWLQFEHSVSLLQSTGVSCAGLAGGYFNVHPRLVIAGGAPTSRVMTFTIGDSSWSIQSPYTSLPQRYHWEEVASLGAGNYSVTLEMRGVPSSTTSLRAISISSVDVLHLVAIEGMTSHE